MEKANDSDDKMIIDRVPVVTAVVVILLVVIVIRIVMIIKVIRTPNFIHCCSHFYY